MYAFTLDHVENYTPVDHVPCQNILVNKYLKNMRYLFLILNTCIKNIVCLNKFIEML